jgi:hypothetical protein
MHLSVSPLFIEITRFIWDANPSYDVYQEFTKRHFQRGRRGRPYGHGSRREMSPLCLRDKGSSSFLRRRAGCSVGLRVQAPATRFRSPRFPGHGRAERRGAGEHRDSVLTFFWCGDPSRFPF